MSYGKYYKIFGLAVVYTLRHYKGLIGLAIFLFACMVIFVNLWEVIGAIDWNARELVWYIALNQWILLALPQPEMEIEHDLRSGGLAYQLIRPISYMGARFCESLGQLIIQLVILCPVAFIPAWVAVGGIPIPYEALPMVFFLTVLAGCVAILFQLVMGISAFWIHEVDPVTWLWEKMLFALGGLILPLSVYPEWCQTLAKYTPFPYILGRRSGIVLDFSWSAMGEMIGSLMIWIVIGTACLALLYRRGLRILNIEGG